MGGSGSRTRGLWPFSSPGPEVSGSTEQSLARIHKVNPFIFTRRGSMYFDEDGDLAHEFYEETIVTKNGRKRAKLKRIHKNLRPQGTVKLDYPCIHVDFPVVLCEV
uniref:Tumor suppressor 2, mitochondrial calcium regulator n=1 Tax=Leptobrachium leishanense TaxID=445787 RepID=A0A8C5PHK0_9ANUR